MESNESRYPEYPMFKGLQKPLEFWGLQGRYIWWAAATFGAGFVGFLIANVMFGFMAGLVTVGVIGGVGIVLIVVKQSRGLYSKKIHKGVYVFYHDVEN